MEDLFLLSEIAQNEEVIFSTSSFVSSLDLLVMDKIVSFVHLEMCDLIDNGDYIFIGDVM